MVTKKELEGVLDQMNAIFKNMEQRIQKLEEQKTSSKSEKKTWQTHKSMV